MVKETRLPGLDSTRARVISGGNSSLISLLVKLGLGLGLVLLLAWGMVALLKRSAIGRQLSSSSGGAIRVVERNYLGQKKAIYLVQIGERVLALGVTDAQIAPLSEWAVGELDLTQKTPTSSFAGHMRSVVSGRQRGGKTTDAEPQQVVES